MIRPVTLITALLAAGSGAYLFGVKHHAQMLQDQLSEVGQQAREDAARVVVLQAQWSLEIDPTKLKALAAQFTRLQPMQPQQLVTLASLTSMLPAPGTRPPEYNPELGSPPAMPPEPEDPADLAQAAPDGAGGPQLADALPPPPPLPPLQAPVVLASDDPAPKPLAMRPARHPHADLPGSRMARALPPPVPATRYAPPHVAMSEIPARSVPLGAQVMSVKAAATVPQYAPPPVPSTSGSALGMAANLPPPLPLQPGMNN